MSNQFNKVVLEYVHKSLSIANIAINRIIRPVTEKTFQQLTSSLSEEPEEQKQQDNNKMINTIKSSIRRSISWSERIATQPIRVLGDWAQVSQHQIEQTLKQQYGYDVNGWIFSKENLEILDRVQNILNLTLSDIDHITTYKKFEYLMAFATLQKITRAYNEDIVFGSIQNESGNKLNYNVNAPLEDYLQTEIKQITEEFKFYSKFAHGIYGDLLNYVLSGKEYLRIINKTNYNKEFITYAKIQEEDVLHTFWDATPYRPGYCIVKSDLKQEIILALRGSNNWADFITDLVFTYVNFSIYQTQGQGTKIKVNYCLSAEATTKTDQKKLIEKLLQDIGLLKEDNPFLDEELIQEGTQREAYRGYAHSGMFASALSLYIELLPILESIFAQVKYRDYKLTVTGHSLGGGMTQLMIFLFLLQPPKFMTKIVHQNLKGYAFGSPPVLSQEFTGFFQGKLFNLVNEHDFVCRLCFGIGRDLARVIKFMENLEKIDKVMIKQIINVKYDENEQLDQATIIQRYKHMIDSYKLIKQNELTTKKLVLQGRVFQLKFLKRLENKEENINDIFYSMEEIKDYSYFNDFIFSKTMILYHFPYLYEEGLESKLVLSPSKY